MLLMRSAAAAAPCSLAAMVLRRFSSYAIRRHGALALSSPSSSTTRFTAWSPALLSCSPRARGFSVWASAPGPAGSAESPAMQLLEAKIKEQLEADAVTVIDTSGDGRHTERLWVSRAVSPSAFGSPAPPRRAPSSGLRVRRLPAGFRCLQMRPSEHQENLCD